MPLLGNVCVCAPDGPNDIFAMGGGGIERL